MQGVWIKTIMIHENDYQMTKPVLRVGTNLVETLETRHGIRPNEIICITTFDGSQRYYLYKLQHNPTISTQGHKMITRTILHEDNYFEFSGTS